MWISHLPNHQLARLERATGQEQAKNCWVAPSVAIPIGLFNNGTIDGFVRALVGSAVRHGLDLDCVRGDLDQYRQDDLEPRCGLGFDPTGVDTGEANCWVLQTNAAVGDIPIEIERKALGAGARLSGSFYRKAPQFCVHWNQMP